jgi:hypothetical protein
MTARPRRILGIDPGLRVTGFGLIELHGTTLVYVASGCNKAGGSSLPVRLGVIARDLAHVIADAGATEVAGARFHAAARYIDQTLAFDIDNAESGHLQSRIDAEDFQSTTAVV